MEAISWGGAHHFATESVTACPACFEVERSFLFESHDWIHQLPGQFRLMRCGACASVYPDPRPTPAAYYPASAYYAYKGATRHRLFARAGVAARVWYAGARGLLRRRHGYTHLGGSSLVGSVVQALPPLSRRATFSLEVLLHPWRPVGSLLDVGCGSGRYLDLMRAPGLGRRHQLASHKAACDALDIEAYCGELADVGFPGATFDAVTLSHTLEHVADPTQLLAEVRRVTKPGGRIAILVPNVRSWLSQLFGRYWLGLYTPRHLINFSPSALRVAIERSGLEIGSIRTSPIRAMGVGHSASRVRGRNAHVIYTDADHRFPVQPRAIAATLAASRALSVPLASRREQIGAVTRR